MTPVTGLTVGVKYAYPLSPRNGLFLGAGLAAGAYAGINGSSTTQNNQKVNDSGKIEYVPGARLRLSLDYFVTRHVLLGVSVGYSQIGKFQEFVGPRRDYSGPEAALTFGFGWGR